jgi:hypothetical protein
MPEDRVWDRSGGRGNPQLSRKENNEMKKTDNQLTRRRKQIIDAWRAIAPDAVLNGKTLEQWIEATKAPGEVRQRMDEAKSEIEAMRQKIRLEESGVRVKIADLLDALKGAPEFGANSPLYRAFGYVPRNARKSGLTRKSVKPDNKPSADAA